MQILTTPNTDLSTKNKLWALDPEDPKLGGERWLLVWALDPLGECTCPAGTRRWSVGGGKEAAVGAVGSAGRCGSPGKHPWSPWVEGKRGGFAHGSGDAVTWAALRARPASRVHRAAVTLEDLVVVDIDSERSMRDLARIWACIPGRLVLGVARTPRGWHVYLDVPGWNQRALNLWLEHWLGDWHPTDARKVSRRGLVLDFRTGARRYVVWPEGSGEAGRRWAGRAEFRDALSWAARGIPPWRMVTEEAGRQAPWNLEMSGELRALVARYEGSGASDWLLDGLAVEGEGPGGGLDLASVLERLDIWCERLAGMEPESGRNNALNRLAFFDGAAAIRAGMARAEVEDRLRAAAAACGCPGAEATIRSGLDSGLGR